MQPDGRDMARLWDMLDAARAIMEFIRGKRYEDLLRERMLRNAVERNLEIIGEAARCLSQEFREAHSETPWRAMISLRNVLAHEYGDIRYERLWAICTDQLPDLVEQLEELGVESPPEPER
jgi:uncharacterized protein with HEPN domain